MRRLCTYYMQKILYDAHALIAFIYQGSSDTAPIISISYAAADTAFACSATAERRTDHWAIVSKDGMTTYFVADIKIFVLDTSFSFLAPGGC